MEAWITCGIAPLMTEPRQDCERADEVLYGMKVEVLAKEGEWARVRTHYRYEGWTQACNLLADQTGLSNVAALEKRVVCKPFADLLAEPKVQSYPLLSVPRGAVLGVTGEMHGPSWVQVVLCDGRTAWTRATYLSEYITSWSKAEEQALRRALVDSAMAYLGTQYRWGGKTTLGIDCSGLCSMAYLLNGVVIYRDAQIKPGFCLHRIEYKDIKMGDLMFFPGHVGMYIADGQFIHSTSHEGDEGVVLASLKPGAPGFRGDLLETMRECGSIF